MIKIKDINKQEPILINDIVMANTYFSNPCNLDYDDYLEWFKSEYWDSVIQAELYILQDKIKDFGFLNLFYEDEKTKVSSTVLKLILEEQNGTEKY